jgi:hypothetical protein
VRVSLGRIVEISMEATVTFRSGQQRARLATLAFWASIGMAGVVAASTLWQFDLWRRIGAGLEVSLDEAELSDGLSAVIGLLDVGVLFATGITFLMWFHRVRANLPALGVADARWSPGWAVGWWFVPVMSLFRPYQVAAEIWQASDPAATQADWRQRPVGSMLGWWWGLFIAAIVVEQVSFRLWMRVDEYTSADVMQNLALLDVTAAAVNVVGALLAIRVIREIDRRQSARVQLSAFT